MKGRFLFVLLFLLMRRERAIPREIPPRPPPMMAMWKGLVGGEGMVFFFVFCSFLFFFSFWIFYWERLGWLGRLFADRERQRVRGIFIGWMDDDDDDDIDDYGRWTFLLA